MVELTGLDAGFQWSINITVDKGEMPEHVRKQALTRAAMAGFDFIEEFWNKETKSYDWPEEPQ